MERKLGDSSLLKSKAYVNGEWQDALDGDTFEVINPATEKVIAVLPEMNDKDVSRASLSAQAALKSWRMITGKQRGKMLRKWADLMNLHAADLGTIITSENGKPYAEAKGEVAFAASYLEFYAGEAERGYGDIIPSSNSANRIFAVKQPIGVAACLTPYNFPAAMITRKAGAALAAGCTVVVKPAGETPLTALALAHLAEEAGIPQGVLNVITALENTALVGKALCEVPHIRKLSYTGSTPVGRLLVKQCAHSLKKLSMELGGNSPFIIFDDANLQTAMTALMAAKIRNSGQTCVCANRIFVQRGIYQRLTDSLVENFKGLRIGDGMDDGTNVGPLTSSRGVEKAQRHVQDAISKGAKPIYTADFVNGKGYFFPPSVLTDMKSNMLSHEEEIFAPIAALYPFDSEEEAIEMANNCDVGLGSYICTTDVGRMWRVAEQLEAGMVGVNTGVIAGGEIPFGGVKASGFGLEGGRWGVEEFLTTKAIVMAIPAAEATQNGQRNN